MLTRLVPPFFNRLILLGLCLFSSLSFFSASVLAQEVSEMDAIANIREVLSVTQPDMLIGNIKPSPIAGLYEVNIQNSQTLYASADANYFIPGDLYQLSPQGLVNLGEQKRNVQRGEKIAALDESEMIVFEAKGERKGLLTVFTDVDCPYCSKLHAEVSALNGAGIAVRYLAYPRTGLDTETYFKMVSTWCSEDRQLMYTVATRGGDVASTECANPVSKHYRLGREVGVTGTPALVLEDGSLLPGYIPAATLISYILPTP